MQSDVNVMQLIITSASTPTTGQYGKQHTGLREASRRIVCRVTKHQQLDPVEGSAPSEAEKEFAYETGAGNIEVPASTA
jgi:hypothetical protein